MVRSRNFDNIYITGQDEVEHKTNLEKVCAEDCKNAG